MSRSHSTSALIVVDFQNDFVNGSLTVPNGVDIADNLNLLKKHKLFDLVVLTIDWHPHGHISFASSHPGKKPFESIEVSYGTQMLWPDHCIQDTEGAEIHSSMHVSHKDIQVKKGYNPMVDSYSGFLELDKKNKTELDDILKKHHIRDIYVTGLAYDYCVKYTCLDGIAFGYNVHLIEDAAKGITPDGVETATKELEGAGVKLVKTQQVLNR
ncbi:nicotinamidase [Planoprotostelium fungivorum]|uniref:nicotinamidase n=1 Tax=Planoprotostelium fungivorum TaxID=1890364 RepID=A0A2P6NHR3_9EUKA|nr:nicotinamidase [Planoprotostelium fungivorum]